MNKPEKERTLLFRLTRKDFIVEALTSGGKGGQRANRRHTACRISHPPSGAVGHSSDESHYKQNEKLAFNRMLETKEFRVWHKLECAKVSGLLDEVDKRVEEEMKNIRVDVKDDKGRWVPEE